MCVCAFHIYTHKYIYIYIYAFHIYTLSIYIYAFQVAQWKKNSPANAVGSRDMGLISGLGRSPGEGNGNPLQYSCLENSMDRGAWRALVHSVTKSWSQFSAHTHTHTHTHN